MQCTRVSLLSSVDTAENAPAQACGTLSTCVYAHAVYLLDELATDAQSGMPEVGLLVDFCVKRLTARPPVVKQKVADETPCRLMRAPGHACALLSSWRNHAKASSCMRLQTLRLIKHLCNKGAHEFRRAMARHSTNVRCV